MLNSIFNHKNLKLSLIATSVALIGAVNAADYYQVIDLGPVDSSRSEAFSINDSNQVVGSANGTDFLNRAFLYNDGQSDFLSYLPYTFETDGISYEGHSFAFDINNSNIAVGVSEETVTDAEDNNVNVDTAVIFDIANSTVVRIPQFLPGEPHDAKALAINDNGLVVGFGNFDPPEDVDDDGDPVSTLLNRGFIYDIGAQSLMMVNPLNILNSNNVILRDVNNNGIAVGVTTDIVDEIPTHQVIMVDVSNPDVVEKLDIFGSVAQQPWAVNNNNKVVGSARTEDNSTTQAFIYDIDFGSATGLGYLNDNFKYSEAYDLNENNQVVGISQFQNSPSVYHAFLYDNGVMRNLNDLIGCDTGWVLNEARSINDYDSGFNSGVITGSGLKDGEKRAFMLMPIAGTAPDCSADDSDDSSGSGSTSLFGLGIVFSMLLFRRRRQVK